MELVLLFSSAGKGGSGHSEREVKPLLKRNILLSPRGAVTVPNPMLITLFQNKREERRDGKGLFIEMKWQKQVDVAPSPREVKVGGRGKRKKLCSRLGDSREKNEGPRYYWKGGCSGILPKP